MYSMILMAALTTGTDMPDMGRRGGGGGCCGCYGGMAYGGCYGGGWGGGYGGCYGGGWGGWGGCYGGGGMGWGGCYGGGGWGGCYGGGWGGRAWGGGYGGGYVMGGISPLNGYASSPMLYGSNFSTPMVMGNSVAGLGTNQSFYLNPTTNNQGTEATIIVHLPANARLTIDGQATQSTSGTRTFVSPPLEAGKTYTYTLRGELNRGGRMVNAKKTVDVHAGRVAEVTLNFPAANQEAEGIGTPAPGVRNGNAVNPIRTPRAPRSLPTPPDDQ